MKKHIIAIIFAGITWGTMGYFVRNMLAMGFDSYNISIARFIVSAVLFGIYLLIADRKLFRFRIRTGWPLILTGLIGLLFLSVSYYRSIELSSMSTAALLLYTAPAIVVLVSAPVFKEKLTKRKILALILAFAGSFLVSGVLGGEGGTTLEGVAWGMASGLFYALYSIFARLGLERGYDSRTINFYSCTVAAIGGLLIMGSKTEAPLMMFFSAENILWSAVMGTVSCVIPYMLYTYGLTGVETGKASVMAFLEPVTATVVGFIAFGETVTLTGFMGIALVLAAVIILNTKKDEKISS